MNIQENNKIEQCIRNILSEPQLDSVSYDDLCVALGLIFHISKAKHFNANAYLLLESLFPLYERRFFDTLTTSPVDKFELMEVYLSELANEKAITRIKTIKDFIELYIKAKRESPLETIKYIKEQEEILNLTDMGLIWHEYIWFYPKCCIKKNKFTWREYVESLVTKYHNAG